MEAPYRKFATKAGYEMSAQYLYRRPSGIYFVRLCVPARLKQVVGKGEMHRSTGCRDLRLAKIVAADIAAHWHRALEAVQHMDPQKIKAGSISLLGSGFVGLAKAAAELGAEPADLAQRLADRGGHFFVDAADWAGWALESIFDGAEYEHDEFHSTVMVLPPKEGVLTRFNGRLRIRHLDEALKAANGEAFVCQFLVWPSPNRGFVVDLPGQLVRAADLHIPREDAEGLRTALAAALGKQDATPGPTQIGSSDSSCMRFSALADAFLARKKPFWKQDQLERKTDQCRAFREITNDPLLSQITRLMIRQFSDTLAGVPTGRGKARHRFGQPEAGYPALIELAQAHGLPKISANTHRRFLDGISEVFEWGVKETYLSANPAKGLGAEIEKAAKSPRIKENEQRAAFSDAELAAIFSVEWFARGAGRKTPQGRFHAYRPHYYWLPLLALHCGGRLNELAQLYLADFVQVDGIWCVDFNLDTPDKLSADGDDDASADKSLKTTNAQRQIPLHSRLISLGLLEYIAELKSAGHQRLYPELGFDKRKGYGKAAGSWFNERFLGRQLGMERDGRKSFHSFRHNFATALGDAEIPTITKSDLLGHGRSSALAESRYDKGRKLPILRNAIEKIRYELPVIEKFSIHDGLQSVKDALRLKKSHSHLRLK